MRQFITEMRFCLGKISKSTIRDLRARCNFAKNLRCGHVPDRRCEGEPRKGEYKHG